MLYRCQPTGFKSNTTVPVYLHVGRLGPRDSRTEEGPERGHGYNTLIEQVVSCVSSCSAESTWTNAHNHNSPSFISGSLGVE